MKPQLTLLAFFLFFTSLTAQVKFKVQLLTDNQTFQVSMKPLLTYSGSNATIQFAQVTLRAPVGFTIGNLANIKGSWTITTVTAPSESPGYNYFLIGLDNPVVATPSTVFAAGVEIPLFTIKRTGASGVLALINNATDPFNVEPNSASISGVGSFINIAGAGPGVDAFSGDYGYFPANTNDDASDCSEIFDVALTPPSTCGITDGSITISATNDANPMQYTIKLNEVDEFWQTSPTFTGLAAGFTYYVAIKGNAAICDVNYAGAFQLPGPLAAIIQSVDLNNPSCGGTNGSISINAISASGGPLEYAMSTAGPWGASSTFSNLAEGTYSFWVRDQLNQCQDPVGTYTLTGCVPQTCNTTFDLQPLGNGRFEVNLITDTTLNDPWNMIANLQVTLKVPTGCFEVSNVTSQVTDVTFAHNGTTVAPIENPDYDYLSFGITNIPTKKIPFVEGNTVHLFTFENTGNCVGDSIRLMPSDDPAINNATAALGQLLTVSGLTFDNEVCLGNAAALISSVPPSAPDCDVSLDIQNLGNGLYGVSMTPDTTLTAPWNAIVGMNITLKTLTGGFQVSNVQSQIPMVTFTDGSVVSPPENPANDYFFFNLESAGTTLVPFVAGDPVLLFTFENTGTCVGDSIGFMLPNDPAVNNATNGLAQQMTVAGLFGDASICFIGTTVECDSINGDPCAGTSPNFGPLQGCEGALIQFIDSTITNETITSWSWNFGDGSPAVTGQNPSHTFSSSGNFEVSLTVTTQGGCDTTFMEFVTVFPSPGDAPVSNYTICNGVGVTIETPDNITSAVWTPTTGLDLTDPFNPIANPASNSTYSLTATNSYGCVNTSQVMVTVVAKPTLTNVAVTAITDCNKSDGTITITATGTGVIQYGIDSGSGINWQAGNSFANLPAGTYNVYVRNGDGSCPVAHTSPIVLNAPVAPTIISVSQVQPVGCNNNGSITVNTTGGTAPLQYSITGGAPFQSSNVFSNLGAGTYNVIVRNSDGTCTQAAGPYIFTQPAPPTIQPVADQTICVGASTNISVQLSTPIASYTINGNSSFAGASINGSTLTFPVTAVMGATNYTVVLRNADDCSATEMFTITGVAVPTASFTVSPIICTNGNVVLNFNGTASPNATLTWNLAGAQIQNQSPQNGNNPANATMVVRWTTAGAKTVTLTVNNGGTCEANSSQTINVSTFNPSATFANTDASCGLSNGAINMSVTGTGFNYNWSSGVATQDISNLAAGAYFVTITDPASTCQTTASTTVAGSPALTITNTSTVPATVCTGANGDGSITVQLSGGTPGYTYSLVGPSAVTPVSISMTSVTFNNLVSGTYTVTATDSEGCNDTETVVLGSQTSLVTVNVTTVNAACTGNNGSLTATPSGGTAPYTYTLIKNNAIISSNQPVTGGVVMLNGLEPAIYNLIFQDNNGCIGAGTGNVMRNAGTFSAIETITPASCGSNNGAISFTGVPAGATVSPSVLTNLAAGPYTVTITESNGCTSSKTFVVPTSGGQTIAISVLNNASCGLANGSVLYTVNGGGAFSYSVLGANLPSGFGTPGIQDTIMGLEEGAYVLEVTDLASSSNCKSYQVFSVGGSDALQTTVVVDRASGCGYHDGEICITVEGGQAPYSVVSNAGTIVQGASPNAFCVNGLYEGMVQLEVTAAGCVKTIVQDMGDFVEPNITIDSVEVVNAICPGDEGTLRSNSSMQYQIHHATTGALLETTPWTNAPQAEYLVIATIDGCSDSLVVEVGGPANWSVVASIIPDSCLTEGSVSLAVGGANAPYDFDWESGEASESITGLDYGTYNVTITDALGCEFEASYLVDNHCLTPPCEDVDIFYADTIFHALEGPNTPICLPTELTNLELYGLVLNGDDYDRTIGDCGSTTTFYDGFDMLPLPGPYVLASWEYDGPGSPLTNFSFSNVNDLLSKMKELDNLGNWVYGNGRISGGKDGFAYNDMFIKEVNSGIITESPASQQIVPKPMILVDNSHFAHVLVAVDPDFGCMDTLYINLVVPVHPSPDVDTIAIEIMEGETLEQCIPVNELVGTVETLVNDCDFLMNNAQVISTGDTCVNVVGLEAGSDQACIVICDDLGECDTTYLVINVIDGSTDIEVFTGFSPNGDGVNDFFKIKNINLYPNNSLTIFNRWGKTVLNAQGYNNGWDGAYRNTKLPDGSYFYILVVNVNGKEKEYKGFVELRR